MTSNLNVLLVEDSEDDAELLFLELRRGGLKVNMTRVETEMEFRDELANSNWNLILSDYNLPTFNAPQALDIFVESEIDVPFIILSGAVAAEDVVALLKAGANDFLEKNDLARLVPAIERELREVKVRKERKMAQRTLKKLYRAVEQSPVSVMITDEQGRVEYVNPTYEKVTGYRRDEVIGRLPDVLTGEFVSIEQNAEIWESVKNDKEWRGEFCNHHKSGQSFWEYVTLSPIKNSKGVLTNLLISKEDITYRKEAEEKLYRQANFDDLTELPNRALVLDRLGQAIERSDQAALITLDMDNFKKVNDSLGHAVGDQLLKQAAQRLNENINTGQTVGRVSGDEFGVVIPAMSNGTADADIVLSRIMEAFNVPFYLGDHEIFTTLSGGVTLYPDDGNDPAILFKNAEAAMRRAKEAGRNGFRFFAPQMNERAEERMVLESGLRRALPNDELRLFYQPIMDGHSGKIAGAEALIRWFHPERGIVPPDKFIPLAEETGLIVPIGKWIIETACQALRDFQDNGFEDIYVAINVSAQQMLKASLVNEVADAIKMTGVKPENLVVEVTESVCMDDTDVTFENLRQISELGVRLAIDDFGTGYSSLSYLKKYPFNTLKIDRAFVDDTPHDQDDVKLVEAMIAMAHSLGLKVVAEGVENDDHVNFLCSKNCDLLQGYHYSRPVPKEEFLELK